MVEERKAEKHTRRRFTGHNSSRHNGVCVSLHLKNTLHVCVCAGVCACVCVFSRSYMQRTEALLPVLSSVSVFIQL